MTDKTPSAMIEVPQELLHRVYNVLAYYANEASYEAPRTGGVVAGCPRGPKPTPQDLVWSARWVLRDLEHQVLKRDAWDWIGKYEPVGPHCDTCRCATSTERPGDPFEPATVHATPAQLKIEMRFQTRERYDAAAAALGMLPQPVEEAEAS